MKEFMRFVDVAIPKGSQIDVAHISFYPREDSNQTTASSRLIGVDEQDALAPTSAADAEGRDRTDAYVDWIVGAWTINTWTDSDEITGIIEEIVGRDDWSSGNALVIYSNFEGNIDIVKAFQAYEAGEGSIAPRLYVEYTEAAVVGPFPTHFNIP